MIRAARDSRPLTSLSGDQLAMGLSGLCLVHCLASTVLFASIASVGVAFDNALAQTYFSAARESLDALKEQAIYDNKAAAEDAAANGTESWFRQYAMEFSFEATAIEGDIISVLQNVYSYTGGAHPNYALQAIVQQKGQPEPVAEASGPAVDEPSQPADGHRHRRGDDR